jgi:drug/metabolite transporter (DMT)-like permease
MRYRILIVIATVIWGSSFVVVKDLTNQVSPAWILVVRFTGAAIVMAVALLGRRQLYFEKSHVGYGLLFGLAMFFAYYLQTIGITDTTPGKNAFLTGTYCVMVPFLS